MTRAMAWLLSPISTHAAWMLALALGASPDGVTGAASVLSLPQPCSTAAVARTARMAPRPTRKAGPACQFVL